MSNILLEKVGYTALLTINRPDKMNALNFPSLLELRQNIKDIRFDSQIRTVVITGAGEKAFSAGADLKERAGMTQAQVKEFLYTINHTFREIEELPQPVIGAINALALGGGTELALACDIRLASTTATMGLTEVTLGIIPGAGGTQRLTRLIGTGRAKEIILTGRKISAQEALEWGLVNSLAEPAQLIEKAMAMAEMINQNGPIAVQQAKFAINYGAEVDLQTGLNIEAKAYQVCLPTKDRLEGLAAFKEKRKPEYKGE